ncbi:MAG: glycosyltransferase [Chloroflexi bacterium]|nr:glycosyltransferase [Chloroflexota bacterium]
MTTAQKLPGISCICMTYARPHMLEEALHSFLLQDYPGPKELIVLNDYAPQILEFGHPDVCVINLPYRFRTVGEKMTAAVGLAQYDLICVWDDDDIYLPHRLSFSANRVSDQFFKPDRAWYWANGEIFGPLYNVFHVGSCYPRSLFDLISGYKAMGNGYDWEFETDLRKAAPERMEIDETPMQDLYYVYRWDGTQSYHMSGSGGWGGGQNETEGWVQARVKMGEIPSGCIPLNPHWRQDYRQMALDAQNPETLELNGLLTVGIWAGDSPAESLDLVRSIRQRYSDISILVVGGENVVPELAAIANLRHVTTSIDTGMGCGRNLLLKECATEYLLVADPNYRLTEATDLRAMLFAAARYRLEIVGCRVIDCLPDGRQFAVDECWSFSAEKGVLHHRRQSRGKRGPYTLYDRVGDFFLCRVSPVRKSGWDEVFHAEDFGAFFLRSQKARLGVGLCAEAVVERRIIGGRNEETADKGSIDWQHFQQTYGFVNVTYADE